MSVTDLFHEINEKIDENAISYVPSLQRKSLRAAKYGRPTYDTIFANGPKFDIGLFYE